MSKMVRTPQGDLDDDRTPVELRRASPERRALTNLALALAALRDDILAAASDWDGAAGDEQRVRALQLSIKLGQAGDELHEARRIVREFGLA